MSNLQQQNSVKKTFLAPTIAGVVVGGMVLFSGQNIIRSGFIGTLAGIGGAVTASVASADNKVRIKLLEAKISQSKLSATVEQLEARYESITQEINELEEGKRQSEAIAGELEARRSQREILTAEIQELQSSKQDLESRITLVHKQNPTLDELEKRQQKLASLQEEVSQLEGKQYSLQQHLAQMEKQKSSLQEIEARFLRRQEEIKEISERIVEGKAQIEDLNRKVVELEFVRNTYDQLAEENIKYESNREHLQAEVLRLESEKHRVLSAIKDLEAQAQESERLRIEIVNLKAQKREVEMLIRETSHQLDLLETNIEGLRSDIASKETEIARKLQQEKDLNQRIRELRTEIDDLENSEKVALQALERPIENLLPQKRQSTAEEQFLQGFTSYLESKGLNFHPRVVNAFHTSLKVQDISALVILAGISGTGKSELPQKYAEYLGAPLVMLPVQPRWDSPQDLQGFYNYIEKKYKPTELMRYLYQYQKNPQMKDRIILVLLDEMNLARVEYYFSDFLSKLESRRNGTTTLSLDVGSLKLTKETGEVLLPQQFLFVGTMNEDETTQSLSDKVLDRANVLTFGKPNQLRLREERNYSNSRDVQISNYVSWENFEKWTKIPNPNDLIVEDVKRYVDQANEIMEILGHPFAHRVYQAIAKYVINYPGSENEEIRKQAIADQFGQKILPKLRGLRTDGDGINEQLVKMRTLIGQLGDKALLDAFDRAKQGRYGQFQWKGMVYQDENI